MFHRILSVVAVGVFLLSPAFSASAKTLTRAEDVRIPASGITKIAFQNLEFTDVVYRGASTSNGFSFHLVKTASNGDEQRMETLLSEIRLETRVTGSTLEVRVIPPRRGGARILDRLFNHDDWRATLEVSGPSRLDADINAKFAKVHTSSTSGDLFLRTEFSESEITDHQGQLRVRAGFGSIRGENIRGGFDVDTSFSHVILMLSGLERDSRVNVSFGGVEIGIPKGAGAVFRSRDSFGSIAFDVSGSLARGGIRNERRILNGGGPEVTLNTDFGNIQIRDNRKVFQTAERQAYRENAVMPLNRGAWWTYTRNNETLTLRVENTRAERGQTVSTLSFGPSVTNPFGSIEVFETPEGLYLSKISQSLFGRNLTGITLDPPRLWLPYRAQDSPVEGGDLLGTVRMVDTPDSVDTPAGKMGNVITWQIETVSGESHRLQLVPGVGFISFDQARLTGYDLSGRAQSEQPEELAPPAPEFARGVIRSIDIQGNRVHSDRFYRRHFGLQEGNTYTREEIDAAVRRLEEISLVDYVSYYIDPDGDLIVRVYESRPFSHEFGVDASFNRVTGLGLGPSLRIMSKVAPVSEVNGYARYNWGVEDWTWAAGLHRDFFGTNRLRIGGGYRVDYGSNMDWAISQADADLNAFFLGYSAENYFRSEGGNAYISQSWGDRLKGQVELFDNKYFSAEKNTNWSLFNRGKTKEPNASLSPRSEGWLTGVRYSLDIWEQAVLTEFRSRFELERSFQYHASGYPAYTRLFAEADWNVQYWYGQLVKFRLAGGYSPHVLPDQRSFRLGGLNTLRGFPSMSVPSRPAGTTPFTTFDGGDRMFLMNLDYFYGEGISIIFFGDLGGVWRKGESATANDLKRDLGIGLALGNDFFSNNPTDENKAGFRVNWAVPVGNESHISRWTVNFVREY